MKTARALALIVIFTLIMACSGFHLVGKDTPAAEAPQAAAPQVATTPPEPTAEPSPTVAPTLPPTAAPTDTPEAAQAGPAQAGVQTSGFVRVRFFGDKLGWGVDTLGNILSTTKGMIAWKNVSPPGAKPGVGPSDVTAFFLDPRYAWATYQPQSGGPSSAITIWSTADSGATWKQAAPIASTGDSSTPVALFFTDPQHGWFLEQIYPGMNHVYAQVFATQDGGKTWTLVSDATTGSDTALPGSYSLPYGTDVLAFVSPKTGFSGGKDLFKTTDGGQTWAAVKLPDPPNAPSVDNPDHMVSPPRFANNRDGILVYTLYAYDKVFCPPCDTSDQLPDATYLYITHDGGETWTPVPAPEKTGKAVLVDAQNGWFAGRSDMAAGSASIYVTSDGGKTWNGQLKDSPIPICAQLEPASPQLLYAEKAIGYPVQAEAFRGCDQPFLYESKDSGKSWKPVVTSPIP
jgi:photosystem II stability/assembly factor-like uncharacterized protein